MPEYTVISRRIYTGTISDLPYHARLAWPFILFEAERLRGRVKLPVRDLAIGARITTPEAADALRIFQEPDLFSSTKTHEGRRLLPIEGEEDWYEVVTWEEHRKEREAFFNRLRQQRYKDKKITVSNGASRSVTNELEPELELEPKKSQKKSAPSSPPKKKSAKELCEGLELTEKLREYAERYGVNAEDALENWRLHFRSNNYRIGGRSPMADADASFMRWIRNASEMTPAALRMARASTKGGLDISSQGQLAIGARGSVSGRNSPSAAVPLSGMPVPNVWTELIAPLLESENGNGDVLRDTALVRVEPTLWTVATRSQVHIDTIRDQFGTQIRAALNRESPYRKIELDLEC